MNKEQLVLMYHDVYRESVNESGFQTGGANYYKIDIKTFEKQVDVLKDTSVIYTFDDGGSAFYSIIAPLLENNGLRGHFFISTNYIGSDGFLTEEQIIELYKRGHIIGSHSSTHPSDFRSLSFEERKREWNNSVSRLNHILGIKTNEISIPNGFLLDEDIPYLKKLGISMIYTSKIAECRTVGSMQVRGRVGITKEMTTDRILNIVSKGTAYYLLVIKQGVLGFAKRLLGDKYVILKKKIRK